MNYWYLVVFYEFLNHIGNVEKNIGFLKVTHGGFKKKRKEKKKSHMALSNRNLVTKIKFVQKYLRQILIILEFKFLLITNKENKFFFFNFLIFFISVPCRSSV